MSFPELDQLRVDLAEAEAKKAALNAVLLNKPCPSEDLRDPYDLYKKLSATSLETQLNAITQNIAALNQQIAAFHPPRTGAHVNEDRRQDIELHPFICDHSKDLGPGVANISVPVIFDTGCAVEMLLDSTTFDKVVETAKLETRPHKGNIGGYNVDTKTFATVSLPKIEASAPCSIYKGPPESISVFGLPLMELMHIRCNPDKSVAKCSEIFMGYRCVKGAEMSQAATSENMRVGNLAIALPL